MCQGRAGRGGDSWSRSYARSINKCVEVAITIIDLRRCYIAIFNICFDSEVDRPGRDT